MFYGTHEHTIDEKNRLTLPAKFRDGLGGGVVLVRGIDGTVDVYPRTSWEASAERISALDSLTREAREMKRFVFAGATVTEIDKQGRVLVPPDLARHASLGQRCRGRRCRRPHRDLEPPAVGGPRQRDRRERRRCCRTCSGQTRLITSPSSARRCGSFSTCSRGRRSSMPRLEPAAIRGRWSPTSKGPASSLRSTATRPCDRTSIGVKASARGVQTRFLRGDYAVVLSQLAGNDVRADAVLLDLGLSSMQVDRPERGFSYATDAPLDMRMDPSDERSAADVLATYDEHELATIFRRYGEERYARQIARGIARRRVEEPIERTGQLVDVVKASIPAPARFGEGHPAKRVFQALRIEVNHELESLEVGLPAAFEMLRPGGRLAVISFHSLEDRIVKRFFRDRSRGCTCPPELPVCVCGKEPEARILTPKPLRPSPSRGGSQPARELGAAARGGAPLMSTIAQAARAPRARTARTARKRSWALGGGVVWIVALALLLAGVVAVNVAVLRLNLQLDEAGRERTELKTDIARLRSEISSAAATTRIERLAEGELGLVEVEPEDTTYIRLGR